MTRSQFQDGPATDHYHNTFGVDEQNPAGAAQAVTLLGPYPFAWNTPGLNTNDGNGVVLATDVVPAGSNVVRVWAVIDVAFNTDTATLALGISSADIVIGDGQPLVAIDSTWLNSPAITPIGAEATPVNNSVLIGIVTAVGSIYAAMSNGGDPATVGSGRVFALIATPA